MVFGGAGFGTVPFGGKTTIGLGKRVLSTVLDLPETSRKLSSVRFGYSANTQVFESPISGSTQTAELSGGKWRGTFNLITLTRAEAQEWIAFLIRLRGMSGRFYAHDPSNLNALGNVSGSTPFVNGGSQAGQSIATSGWAASTTGVLLAGDAISFDTALWKERHIVAFDVDSDADGKANIPLAFPVRNSPLNNDLVVTTNASCIMRLIDNDQAFWNVQTALRFGIQFSGIEVFE